MTVNDPGVYRIWLELADGGHRTLERWLNSQDELDEILAVWAKDGHEVLDITRR